MFDAGQMTVRLFWIGCGVTSTACGIAGIVLPLLPTTPFLLLAAYCFARSSPRLHDWIMTHPQLGPPIVDWQSSGAVSRGAKAAAVATMLVTFGISVAMGLRTWLLAVQGLVLVAVAVFLLSRPSR